MSPLAQGVRPDLFQATIQAERIKALKALSERASKAAVDEAMRYADAKAATGQLSSEQKVELAMYLVDAADYDAPDLRTETESCLSDILAVVRGEA